MTKTEKLADKIAIGKYGFVTVPRKLLPEVAEIITKKYKGTVSWFGIGNALCIRTKEKPLVLKKKRKAA